MDNLISHPASESFAHALPALPYAYAALEPHVDERTLRLHHDKHHASYVDNLNAVIEKHPALGGRSAQWLLLHPGQVPEPVRATVHNNAGGHINHGLLWRAMSPDGGGEPGGELAAAIKRDFGSFDHFKARFAEEGAKVFGSGWVWLARIQKEGGKLHVYTTQGHDNPVMQGHFPLLVNDVWEHAYYLQHENRRADYLKGWWAVANWVEAAHRFALSDDPADPDWGDDREPVVTATP